MTTRTLVVGAFAQIAIIIAILVFMDSQRSQDRRDAKIEAARVMAQTMKDRKNVVAGCKRGQDDRKITAGINNDLAIFAEAAAAKRRADGDIKVAESYEAVVQRAESRVAEIAKRLEPQLICERAFGVPTPDPAPRLLPNPLLSPRGFLRPPLFAPGGSGT